MMPDDTFWDKFWPGLFTSLIVTSLFTFIIGWVIYQFRKPKLEVRLTIGHSLSEKYLTFILKNIGKTTLLAHEVQWSVYFECLFEDKAVFKPKDIMGLIILNNGAFYEERGFNEVPCFPDSCIELVTIPVIPSENFPYNCLDDAQFYVSIKTNKGTWHPSKQFFLFKKNGIKYDDGIITRHIYRITKINV